MFTTNLVYINMIASKWKKLQREFSIIHHLLILNKHDPHITLKTIEQNFGLDIITLSFHTSNVLQLLNVTFCFT
jgi:hypothetical protein